MTDVKEAASVVVDITPQLAEVIIVEMAKRLAQVDDEMPEQPTRVISWFLRRAINPSEG